MKSVRVALMTMAACAGIPGAQAAMPVLVELFTSEGCSDCPPADRLLEQLDRTQPVASAEIIVLSEHVDYWDRLGWKDPFSTHYFSERQEEYARRLHLETIYTPQMVVDGVTEFVGSDGRRALSAIGTAARATKVHVRIAKVSGSAVRVEVDAMNGHSSGVYLAVVEREGNSQVLRGENRGRSLHHVAIVRRIEALGKCDGRKPFATEVRVAEAEKTAFGLVAFVQDSDNGPVRGAAALGR